MVFCCAFLQPVPRIATEMDKNNSLFMIYQIQGLTVETFTLIFGLEEPSKFDKLFSIDRLFTVFEVISAAPVKGGL